jgi:hypothetical protein
MRKKKEKPYIVFDTTKVCNPRVRVWHNLHQADTQPMLGTLASTLCHTLSCGHFFVRTISD